MSESTFQIHGNPMKILRISKGFTCSEIGEKINVSRNHISKCERNTRKLSTQKSRLFLEAIEVTEEEAKEFIQVFGQEEVVRNN